jgi:hypothetical protein
MSSGVCMWPLSFVRVRGGVTLLGGGGGVEYRCLHVAAFICAKRCEIVVCVCLCASECECERERESECEGGVTLSEGGEGGGEYPERRRLRPPH